jgi:hypothetical protein
MVAAGTVGPATVAAGTMATATVTGAEE